MIFEIDWYIHVIFVWYLIKIFRDPFYVFVYFMICISFTLHQHIDLKASISFILYYLFNCVTPVSFLIPFEKIDLKSGKHILI